MLSRCRHCRLGPYCHCADDFHVNSTETAPGKAKEKPFRPRTGVKQASPCHLQSDSRQSAHCPTGDTLVSSKGLERVACGCDPIASGRHGSQGIRLIMCVVSNSVRVEREMRRAWGRETTAVEIRFRAQCRKVYCARLCNERIHIYLERIIGLQRYKHAGTQTPGIKPRIERQSQQVLRRSPR